MKVFYYWLLVFLGIQLSKLINTYIFSENYKISVINLLFEGVISVVAAIIVVYTNKRKSSE